MNKKVLFFICLVSLSILATSCVTKLNLSKLDNNTPVQVGGFGLSITAEDKFPVRTFLATYGDGRTISPERITPFLLDIIENNYLLYAQKASQEGFPLDVNRLRQEFLDPNNPPIVRIIRVGGSHAVHVLIDPQDTLVASCNIYIRYNPLTNGFDFYDGAIMFVQASSPTKASAAWVSKSLR